MSSQPAFSYSLFIFLTRFALIVTYKTGCLSYTYGYDGETKLKRLEQKVLVSISHCHVPHESFTMLSFEVLLLTALMTWL